MGLLSFYKVNDKSDFLHDFLLGNSGAFLTEVNFN